MADGAKHVDDKTVVEFLNNNQEKYRQLLREIVTFLGKVSEGPTAKERIYRIYTRADKQSGNIFKDVWKIVQNVNRERENNPKFQITELRDIIGVTAVVTYPSDIHVVRSAVDAQIRKNEFISHANATTLDGSIICGETKQSRGYYAHHYQLEVNKPHLRNARCELQIKTVLHDAWGAKTHGLTFKPVGALDARMAEQIEVLGDALAVIDRQSELIKRVIERRWALDARKAKYAKLSLVKATDAPDNPSRWKAFSAIRKEIMDTAAHVQGHSLAEPAVQALVSKVDNYVFNGRYDRDACRLFCLLAVVIGTPDLIALALDRINLWLAQACNEDERCSVLRFRALANFNFGNKIDAARDGLSAVNAWKSGAAQRATLSGEQRELARVVEIQMKSSLAYYFADLAGSDAGEKMHALEEATRYMEEAEATFTTLEKELKSSGREPHGVTRSMLLDNKGAVKIAFATDSVVAREGLELCRKAYEAMPLSHKELAQTFFELHEIRAFQRILDLELPL